jgi:hypothetical protein
MRKLVVRTASAAIKAQPIAGDYPAVGPRGLTKKSAAKQGGTAAYPVPCGRVFYLNGIIEILIEEKE